MKYRLVTLGIAFAASLGVAHAASPDLTTAHPVTPYVQHVIDRVQSAFAEAERDPPSGGAFTPFFRASWVDRILSSILSSIDTDLRIVAEGQDLLDNSACLHSDLAILEAWMEKARTEKNAALEAGNIRKILYLIPVQRYLQDRYRALLLGARDPTFVDTTEGLWYGFDAYPGYCCPQASGKDALCTITQNAIGSRNCSANGGIAVKSLNACVERGCQAPDPTSADAADLCPFSTDYLPPSTAGYGCETEVMRRIQSDNLPSLSRELEALDAFTTARDDFASRLLPLSEATEALAATLGLPHPARPSAATDGSPERTHQSLQGCQPPNLPLPSGIIQREKRSPFSFMPDDVQLLPHLLELWRSWGAERIAQDALRTSTTTEGTGVFGWLSTTVRNSARSFMRKWSIDQSEQESMVLARFQDGPLRLRAELTPLTEQVLAFSKSIAHTEGGLRQFVGSFAQFLRLSCVFRPCAEKLDRILKIDFQDACFPYTSDTIPTDAAAECRAAAGV